MARISLSARGGSDRRVDQGRLQHIRYTARSTSHIPACSIVESYSKSFCNKVLKVILRICRPNSISPWMRPTLKYRPPSTIHTILSWRHSSAFPARKPVFDSCKRSTKCFDLETKTIRSSSHSNLGCSTDRERMVRCYQLTTALSSGSGRVIDPSKR